MIKSTHAFKMEVPDTSGVLIHTAVRFRALSLQLQNSHKEPSATRDQLLPPTNEVPVHENLHSLYMNRCKAVRVTVDMKNKNCVFSTYAFLFLLSTGNDQPDQQVKT